MSQPSQTKKGRILSGMRPTGKLHLGNYVGALRNWVNLQDDYDCFFFIADWHALTTDYADTRAVKQNGTSKFSVSCLPAVARRANNFHKTLLRCALLIQCGAQGSRFGACTNGVSDSG